MALGIFFIIFFNFRINQPPAVVPADAPGSLFSADRAGAHLPHIASEPNPIGSQANKKVRRYIKGQLEGMGLTPELHHTEFYYAQRGATLKNVLARIPGSGNGQAVLFMGHYDTVMDAPGASDNGAAVVTLLEVIRMLQHHPPLDNDLIFFFSDGEEMGLLGAQAFVEEHPWAKDVAVVVNLEAMGTGGQSIMFETGANNLKVIRKFAAAVPYPTGNSLSVEIYNRMPNATDFDVFKHEKYQGLNFAYIGNSFDYHTGGDNIENTDLRSVQHHGSYAAALALHLGNSSLDFQSDENAVYFNTIGYGFVSYPYSRVPVITLLVILTAGCIIALGIHKKRIKPLRMFYGFVAFGILLLILYVFFNALFQILSSYYPGNNFRLIEYRQQGILLGFALLAVAFSAAYNSMLMRGAKLWQLLSLLAFLMVLVWWGGEFSILKIAVGLGITAWIFFAHSKPTHYWDLSAGAVAVWVFLMAAAAFLVPGASFLFTWPLLFSLVPLGIAFLRKPREDHGVFMGLLLLIFAVPTLAWFSVIINLFQLAMGLHLAGITMVIAGLMTGLLIPHIYLMTREKTWLIPGVVFLFGLFFLLNNTAGLDYDERHRKQNNVIYATDAATGESYWISRWKEKPDPWTRQFLTEHPDTIRLSRFFPNLTGSALAKQSDGPPLPQPTLHVMADSLKNGERMLKIHLQPERNISRMTFYFDIKESEVAIRVGELDRYNLRSYQDDKWGMFSYFALPEKGITLTVYTRPDQQIGFHLNTHDDSGIPGFMDYTERPSHMMSRGDQSITSRYYQF